MPREFSRAERVAELLQRELAALISQELKDPAVGMVTVTAVRLSRDLGHAKVYVTTMGARAEEEEVARRLNRAVGFLRRELSRRLTLRGTPQLRFVYDHSVERGMALSRLIDSLGGQGSSGGEQG